MLATPRYYSEGPEALVVSLASKGDRDAFAELVRRRQPWIRTLMRRCSGDAHLADDLSQQVFMQAWRKIRQLKEVDKFGGWLKQLAINEWLQHHRKSDALHGAEGEEGIRMSQHDKTSIGMDLDNAMARLPRSVSLCITLSYHARMTHDEIARLTGIQLGTVKSHIRRGSKRLREMLSPYDETTESQDAS